MPETQWAYTWSYSNGTINGTFSLISSGISTWYWDVFAPPTEGSYTFTIRVYDLFCNAWIEGSVSFTVNLDTVPTTPWAAVMLERVFTRNGEGESGAEQTVFAPGEAIQYAYTVNVPGILSVTTSFDVQVIGPREIFSGGGYFGHSPGRWTSYFDGSIPTDAPPGTYTFRATMGINGQSMTKESSFTVSAGSGQPPSPAPQPTLGLPPDPGEAGKATLEGIDSDNDGVRDDVQRYIALNVTDSARHREALRSGAKVIQRELLAQTKEEAIQLAIEGIRTVECLSYLEVLEQGRRKEVQALMLNTEARIRAMDAHADRISGQVFTSLPDSLKRSACTFDVEALPN